MIFPGIFNIHQLKCVRVINFTLLAVLPHTEIIDRQPAGGSVALKVIAKDAVLKR